MRTSQGVLGKMKEEYEGRVNDLRKAKDGNGGSHERVILSLPEDIDFLSQRLPIGAKKLREAQKSFSSRELLIERTWNVSELNNLLQQATMLY
jgi:hypothetical protein